MLKRQLWRQHLVYSTKGCSTISIWRRVWNATVH